MCHLGKVLVVGSLNVDLVSYVPHLPKAGETVASLKFKTNFGGKGANQAYAAAKLGMEVSMIGKVGSDEYGTSLIHHLKQANVDPTGIQIDKGPTGMAFINVSQDGENNIILVPGANHEIKRRDIDLYRDLINRAEVVLIQLEIPLNAVEYVIEVAAELNKKVILNPAPAQELTIKMLEKVHTIIPNETELQILTGMPVSTAQEIFEAGSYLKSLGVKRVIVTAGDKGAYVITDEIQSHVPANKVEVVDTTAAGDTFIAAFATATQNGLDDVEAAEFACKVSGVVVTREGAQASIPSLEEVERYYKQQ